MSNICKTVTLRTRPIKGGEQLSFYLDYYPGYRNEETMKLMRHESLGIYIYARPKNRREQEFNRSMTEKAEALRCLRYESIVNERYDFFDKTKERGDFLAYCLCYGFPCIAILCVSMLVSVKLGADFHGDPLVKAVSFAGCNLLLWLLYVTVFQNLPRELQSLFGRLSDIREKERQSQAATSIPQALTPITDTISPEHYQKVNLSYIRQQEAEKSALTESVIAYAAAVMPPFVCESELARLCSELRNWCDNPGYTPQEVRLKERLSTNDLGHFVYNIAERLGRSNGYNGAVHSRFVKSLFATALADVDTGSIRNFTKTSPCDKIHLDYPKPGDKSFHYPEGEKPA